ncbi:MAG: hypothetical protein QXM38_03000 [Candidatus Aenigmatarchaeota archaeon]
MPQFTIQLKNEERFLDTNTLFTFLWAHKNYASHIEFGFYGEQLEHPKIRVILNFLSYINKSFSILTQGDCLKEKVSFIDDYYLANSHFTFLLQGKDEKTIKKITGKNIFDQILESMEYLKDKKIAFDVVMPINNVNYKQIEDVFDISCHYGCRMFLPIEEFPTEEGKKRLLNDRQKQKVMNVIEDLVPTGRVKKTIQFEPPEANCSYLRKERIFMDAFGRLSHCHFLSYLKNTQLTENSFDRCQGKCILEINEEMRDKFLEMKTKELPSWEKPRKLSSPCSYCLSKFTQNNEW